MKPFACRPAVVTVLSVVTALSAAASGQDTTGARLEDLRALALGHPDSAGLFAQIAAMCFAEGTISGRVQAADCMKQAVRLEPENADYRLMLAEIDFAATYWNYGVQELQRAITILPGHAGARTRLGEAYLDRAIQEWQITRFKQAKQELKRALSIDTRLAAASNLLALCFLDLGCPDSALALVRHLPEDSLDIDALLLEGMALTGKNRIDEASGAFQEALARMDDARRRRYLSRGFWTADSAALEIESAETAGEGTAGAGYRRDQGAAFLAFLWKRDDPDPATPVNERLVEHLARVSFADFHFSVSRLGLPGSETTRGEVYCRYGRPLRWYYDPFGTNTFAGKTVSPGDSDPFGGDDPFANLAEIYRPTPLRLRKPRWVWLYKDFTLTFEDTHLNGDYTFPYEQDWSAYVDAYLKKNLPAIYQTEIRTRMKVALDVVNCLDDQGQPASKVLLACDTRGIDYAPGVWLPSGEFEAEIAFLDSAYQEIARTPFRTQLSAESVPASATRLPLAGTWQVRPPAGAVLAAMSLRSVANGALGYAMALVGTRRLDGGFEMSDLEVRPGPDRPGDPLRVFLGCAKVFLAFDMYNLGLDGNGSGQVEVTYRLTPKAEPPALVTRLLRLLTGRETSAGQPAGSRPAGRDHRVSPVAGREIVSATGARVHHMIPVDVASLVEGEYLIEVEAHDTISGRTATAATDITLSASAE